MAYLVFCTFDLKNATSQNYKDIYSDLEKLGLKKIQVADDGNSVVIPTTSVMGTFNGQDASRVRNDVRDMVKNAFAARGLKAEIFIIVGGNWAWGAASV